MVTILCLMQTTNRLQPENFADYQNKVDDPLYSLDLSGYNWFGVL